MKKLAKIITLCLLLTGCLSCGCTKKAQAGGETTHPTDPSVKFERYTKGLIMHSKILDLSLRFSIYLPESYTSAKDKRYPVVYMLHGYGDDHTSWNGSWLHGNNKIDKLVAAGMGEAIYVYPQGFNSYYCNQYDGKFSYMDMFVKEFIPFIDKTYRTIPDKAHRAITGYSMGGFGAMVLAEKNPGLFVASAPLSMSFRTDWQYMAESQSGWNGQWGRIFGGYGQSGTGRLTDYYKAHCPIHFFNASNKEALSTVHWFLTCGDDEENLLYANDTLHVILRDNGYAHEFRVDDGAHTSSYWTKALEEVLPMFWYYFAGGTEWPGTDMDNPKYTEGSFAKDGTLSSDGYAKNKTGKAIYLYHEGLSEKTLKAIMSIANTNMNDNAYIFFPCDVRERSVTGWQEYWNAYKTTSARAIAIGAGAADKVFASRKSFKKIIFINSGPGNTPVADSEDNLVFACTDDAPCYRAMDLLYSSCKKNGATFEYRVINGSSDTNKDLLLCTEKVKQLITY